MKNLKKNWKGLVPEYFPQLTRYIEKQFQLSKLEKNYPILISPEINKNEQVDLIIKIVFSLARQIPAEWKKTNIYKIIDPYMTLYLREFIWDCFLDYRENIHGLTDETYDNEFSNILELLDKLYETKDVFQISGGVFFDEKFNKKYNFKTKIYKASRLASSKDSNKIINLGAKNNNKIFPLSREEVLYGTKKTSNQCCLLKDYINKKFVKK